MCFLLNNHLGAAVSVAKPGQLDQVPFGERWMAWGIHLNDFYLLIVLLMKGREADQGLGTLFWSRSLNLRFRCVLLWSVRILLLLQTIPHGRC